MTTKADAANAINRTIFENNRGAVSAFATNADLQLMLQALTGYRGQWIVTANYSQPPEMVSYLGALFISLQPNTGVVPVNGPTWMQLATPPTRQVITAQSVVNVPDPVFNPIGSDFTFYMGSLPGSGRVVSKISGGESLVEHATAKYDVTDFPTNPANVYIAPNGNDGNPGTYSSPFLTGAPLTGVSANYVYLNGFTEENPCPPFGYRDTYALGGKLMIVRSLGASNVLGIAGTNLKTASLSSSGGVYSVTVSAYPIRVLYSGVLDALGKPIPLTLVSSLGALTGNIRGWFFNSTTKLLSIYLGGLDVSKLQPLLRAVYRGFDGAGPYTPSDNRALIFSGSGNVKIAYENVTFDGVYPYALSSTPGLIPEIYMDSCTLQYNGPTSGGGDGYGAYSDSGRLYTRDTLIYRSSSDGLNYKTTAQVPVGLEINNRVLFAGDPDTFPQPSPGIVNASSNDGGVMAPVVRVNGTYKWSQGPTIADFTSWNLGVYAGPTQYSFVQSNAPTGVGASDFCAAQNTSRMWCDTCVSGGTPGGVVNGQSVGGAYFAFGTGKLFQYNCTGQNNSTQAISPGGIFPYTPP